jgi:hypothetical protein
MFIIKLNLKINIKIIYIQANNMVKNTKGGSGHKRQARKHTTDGGVKMNRTRFSGHPDELYAICTKMYGGHVGVFCQDGVERLCVLRKKFKGRGKRDNIVTVGTYMLIGKRGFATTVVGKQEKCDLLEVYTDHDKKILKQSVNNVNWSAFNPYVSGREEKGDDFDDNIEFVEDKTIEYAELIQSNMQTVAEDDSNSEDFDQKSNDSDHNSNEFEINNTQKNTKKKEVEIYIDDI